MRAAVLVLLLAGCPGPPAARCNVDNDCPRLERCDQGFCATYDEPPPDAGEPDPPNGPPSIAAVSPLRTRAGATIDVGLDAFDPDGDDVAFEIVAAASLGTASAGSGVSYTAGAVGDDAFGVRPVDARGLAGEPVVVDVHVLPADWIDLGLTSRTRVAIVGSAAVGEVVDGVVVYVRLSAAELGAELLADLVELTLAVSRDGAVVPVEVDHLGADELGLWVRPDTVDARADTGDYFDLYAGGSTTLASPPAADAWPDFAAVYHLEPVITESTGRHDVVGEVTGAISSSCLLGGCFEFDGDDFVLLATNTPDLDGAVTATISATIRYDVGNDGLAVAWSTATGDLSRLFLGNNPGGTVEVGMRPDDAAPLFLSSATPVAQATEVRVDGVIDRASDIARIYVDGELRNERPLDGGGAFAAGGSLRIVLGSGAAGTGNFHDGTVDEVRMSPVARGDAWLRVDALSRAALLAAPGPVER